MMTIFIYTCVAVVFGIGVIVALGGWGVALLDMAVRKTLDLDEWDKEEEGDGGGAEDIETHDIEDCEATLVSTATYSSRRHTSPISTPSSTTSSPTSSQHPTFILKAPK